MTTISEEMNKHMSFIDSMTAWMKKLVSTAPDDFPPTDKYLENIKRYIEKVNANIVTKDKELAAKIEDSEKEMKRMKKLIQFLQENHEEL